MAGFAGARNGVELPEHAPVCGIKCGKKPSNPELSSSDAHHDPAADGERRSRHRIALTIIGYFSDPTLLACIRVKRHQVSVDGSDVDGLTENSHTTIRCRAAHGEPIRHRPFVG